MIKLRRLIDFKPAMTCGLALTACVVFGLAIVPAHAQVSADTKARRLLKENRLEEALAAIDTELNERPRDGSLWLLKGTALSMSERKDEAIQLFRKMIQDKMEVASAYNNLGVIYSERGDFEAARLALDSAVRTRPEYAVALRNLGNVYANMAGVSYKRALQLDESDQSLSAKLAQLGDILGKKFDKLVAPQVASPVEPLTEPSRTPRPNYGVSQVASAANTVVAEQPASPPVAIAVNTPAAEPVNLPSRTPATPRAEQSATAQVAMAPNMPSEPVRAPVTPRISPVATPQLASASLPQAVSPPPRVRTTPVTFQWQAASAPTQPTRSVSSRGSQMAPAVTTVAASAGTYNQPPKPMPQPMVPDLWSR